MEALSSAGGSLALSRSLDYPVSRGHLHQYFYNSVIPRITNFGTKKPNLPFLFCKFLLNAPNLHLCFFFFSFTVFFLCASLLTVAIPESAFFSSTYM